MLRIVLYLATNLAVLLVFGAALTLAGSAGLLPPGLLQARGPLLAMAAVLGFGGSFISLLLSRRIALWTTGARVIDQPRTRGERWLVEQVAQLSAKAGLPPPDVAIYDSPDPNAFATGHRRDRALVAVSTGLLDHLSPAEVRAVLAHEVAHVKNGDMVTLALIQGVLNTFVILASRVIGAVVDRAVFRNERGDGAGFWMTALALELVFSVLATMVVMAFSRYREFRADAGAAALVGVRPTIGALHRLQRFAAQPNLPPSMQTFGVRGGMTLTRLFASHPPLEARISRLARAS